MLFVCVRAVTYNVCIHIIIHVIIKTDKMEVQLAIAPFTEEIRSTSTRRN